MKVVVELEKVSRIEEMVGEGKGLPEMVEVTGLPAATVYNLARRHGARFTWTDYLNYRVTQGINPRTGVKYKTRHEYESLRELDTANSSRSVALRTEIEKYLAQNCMTLQGFSDRAAISVQSAERYRKGSRFPREENLDRIIKVLGITDSDTLRKLNDKKKK